MPAPTPSPNGCCYDCAFVYKNMLPVSTSTVRLKAGGQTVAQGQIIKSESGIVVVVNEAGQNPTFVSLCELENIDSNDE